MAKNWTLKEAVKIITAGENTEAIQEIGKRFPLTTVAIAKIGQNEGVEALMSVMPDHVTMLKLERAFKEGVEDTDGEDDDVEDSEDEGGAGDEKDLSEMTSKQLYALCVKRGIKAKKYGVNKQYYLDLLNGRDGDSDDDAEDDADDTDDEAGEDEVDYDSMKAPELYALCKKRGIKIQPKQKAAVYIKALKAADAEAEDDTDAEDEDWNEEEEESTKKTTDKKPAVKGNNKKEKAAPAKKTAKKEAASEEEEDWDI